MVTAYYMMKISHNKKKLANEAENYYSSLFQEPFVNSKSNKCRVCLQQGSVSIYGSGGDISQALIQFGDIEISENDKYPKLLCCVCYKFIKGAILFRKIAKRSEESLRQTLKVEQDALDSEYNIEYNYSDSANDNDVQSLKSKWAEHCTEVKQEQKVKIKCSQKVTCIVCKKVINRTYIKEHLTMHDPDHEKYVCEVCGKIFRLRCAYHNHRLRHRSDFPFKCQFCPYKGRYAELLKTHMRTHTGDYRYMCTECPARFLFKSNLNSHMLKHKEPQFTCDTCKRAFHTKLMLQRHFEADHLGIKNHVCSVCGKAFGYRNAMMKHQRHVHKREKSMFGRMPTYLAVEQKKNDQRVQ